MTPVKITKRSVDALKSREDGDYFVWDRELKGFGVRVTPAGRKVFVLGYRPQGSRQFKRVTLGAHGALTVDEARRLARRHLGQVADGADPAAARTSARRAPTVAELGEHYLAHVRERQKPKTAQEYVRLWEKHVVPALGTKKVAAVTSADVTRLHRSLRETPYIANRVAALVGSFFTYAAREGVRAHHDNPARGLERYAEQGRERFLSADEFRRLGEALTQAEREGLPPAPKHRKRPKSEATAKHRPKGADVPRPANPFVVAAIRLLALTGAREQEILTLRWDAIDFARGHIRFADSKTGRSVRPLGAAAAEILAGLPRQAGSPYVFPGRAEGRPLVEIKRTWCAVRHAAGLSDVRLHDLRHSVAATSATGGDSLLVIRSLLGHADIQTTQRYAHLGDDPVKAAADRAAGSIAAWLAGSATPVTALQRGTR